MIEFEEPEKGYVFQGSNFTSARPKLRLAALLLIFFVVIVFFIKNDYDFNFYQDTRLALPFQCPEGSDYSNHNDKMTNYECAKRAMAVNVPQLKEEHGLEGGNISFERVGKTKVMKPVVNLTFTGESKVKISDRMCGFEVRALYK